MNSPRQTLESFEASLVPIFVPSAFFADGSWFGPYQRLRARQIGLTWAVMRPNNMQLYVNQALQACWAKQGLDWQALALRNLSEHTGDPPATHALRRDNGEIYSVAFMHSDALGPSRLLLRDRLSAIFPAGYRVAIPEMSCGFAMSLELEKKEMAELQDLIEGCHRKGTRPLAPGIFDSDDLLPELGAGDRVPSIMGGDVYQSGGQ
ncbi:conserved hypothetical protein [Candidatus Sulfopaludibacter sp. SbA4]|nr:conserved hypothetical protein [Candidatus Sulfopaludibacter sp. SbA4]